MSQKQDLQKKLDRLFIVAHLLTAVYAVILGWWALLMIPFALFVFHVGHGAFAHRIFTHNAKSISSNAHWIGHFLFNFCGWGSALVFASIHRQHHKYNGTEQDPHEPKYVGHWNLFLGRYKPSADKRFFKMAYKEYPHAAWFHKHYFKIAWLGMPVFAPVIAAGFWLRFVLVDIVHPNDDLEDTSQDRWWLWPILLGDEAHNLHHRRSYLAKHHNLDFVYAGVKLLQAIP